MQFESYRNYLEGEFEKRKARNAFYSLRAFARDLDVAPSRLSEALNKKRGISLNIAKRLIQKLELDEHESHIFCLSVEAEHSRSVKQRQKARAELTLFLEQEPPAPLKTFTIVDWVAEAVLKLSERNGLSEDAEKMARRLDIPQFMVVSALRFLSRLGLIKGHKNYRTYLHLQSRGQDRMLNVDYAQILEQAQKSYLNQKSQPDFFEHRSYLFEGKDLASAKKIVLKAIEDLRKLEKKTKIAKLYFVSAQLFSVEKDGKKYDKKN